MKNSLLLLFLGLLLSCANREGNEQRIKEAPIKQKDHSIKKVTLSLEPGWGRERKSKDIELSQDGTVYYRLRDDRRVIENYIGIVDSVSLVKIYALLDSVDFNSLKTEYFNAEHAPFYSLMFVFPNGEIQMKGTLEKETHQWISKVIGIIETQNLKKSRNRPFSTAKDVLIPPPPGVIESPESLKHL